VLAVLITAFLRKHQIEDLVRIAFAQGVQNIYISLDGPRNREDELRQIEIIKMIDALRREFPIKIDARRLNENVGAGAAVISGIDWLFEHESQGIVLEDDLSPDPGFFLEADAFLRRNDVSNKVLMFSGTNFFSTSDEVIELLRYPVVWGWATTRDKWATTRSLIFSPIAQLSLSKLGTDFFYWRVGKRRALKGQTQVWDVPLAGAMFSRGYYCALSPTNLITNTGNDEFASNTKENGWPLNLTTRTPNVSSGQIKISLGPSKTREQFMRKNIFKIGPKYMLSSLFWNFFDFIRWRGHEGGKLERTVSSITWQNV
jgi:hypothetical protein